MSRKSVESPPGFCGRGGLSAKAWSFCAGRPSGGLRCRGASAKTLALSAQPPPAARGAAQLFSREHSLGDGAGDSKGDPTQLRHQYRRRAEPALHPPRACLGLAEASLRISKESVRVPRGAGNMKREVTGTSCCGWAGCAVFAQADPSDPDQRNPNRKTETFNAKSAQTLCTRCTARHSVPLKRELWQSDV